MLELQNNNNSLKKHKHFDPHYFILQKPGALPSDEPMHVEEFETQRRNRQSNVNWNWQGSAAHGTRRDPIFVEKKDKNHRATPPPPVSTTVARAQQLRPALFTVIATSTVPVAGRQLFQQPNYVFYTQPVMYCSLYEHPNQEVQYVPSFSV